MSTQDVRTIVDANAETIETFVMKYLLDNGIDVQLVEVVAKELFGQQVVVNGTVPEDVASTPRELVGNAIKEVVRVSAFSDPTFDIDRVVDGAASLEFLVRYARKVNPAVFPINLIPTDEVVGAALALFHASRQPQATTA
jgi:hypothetical protein